MDDIQIGYVNTLEQKLCYKELLSNTLTDQDVHFLLCSFVIHCCEI